MAKRKRVSKKKDQKSFARTAKATRKINLNPVPRRGGIRL